MLFYMVLAIERYANHNVSVKAGFVNSFSILLVDGNIAICISFDCQDHVEQHPFYRFSIGRIVFEKLTVF